MWDLEHWQFAGLRAYLNTSIYFRHSSWLAPNTQPDRIKTYPSRPNLFACRIFIPRQETAQGIWPLVIRVHGGGFIVNNPATDDTIARHITDEARCVVVSIDYSKSPQNKFPAAYEDVIAQSLAVIEDQDLPLDRNRVVLCGSSAGGNLVLAASQDPRLRSKIMGVVAIYPVVDVVEDAETKMATRPNPSVPDFIGDSWSNVKRLYLDAAQLPSLTDPRVSPTYFASRDDLPPEVLLLGAEHDMFCHEAEAMANKLMPGSPGSRTEVKAGWRAPGVRWHKVYGQPHAFDAFPLKDPQREEARVAAVEEMRSTICKWLSEVFASVAWRTLCQIEHGLHDK